MEDSYTVIVKGEGVTYWETEVNSTEVVYAGQPLEPEIKYTLIVVADNGRDSLEEEELIPSLGLPY